MNLITVFVIAFGLAMDAFAVSVASGARDKQLPIRHTFRIALFFGGFQAVMPILGWLLGLSINQIIRSYDHWVAFGLLTLVGSKMIYESIILKKVQKQPNPMNLATLLTVISCGLWLQLF
jgi:putative Mn2+ efflux pump MntP